MSGFRHMAQQPSPPIPIFESTTPLMMHPIHSRSGSERSAVITLGTTKPTHHAPQSFLQLLLPTTNGGKVGGQVFAVQDVFAAITDQEAPVRSGDVANRMPQDPTDRSEEEAVVHAVLPSCHDCFFLPLLSSDLIAKSKACKTRG